MFFFLLCLQFDKSSKEMEEFLMMKQQLQEKEELISTLQAQLSQTQAEQAAQVGWKVPHNQNKESWKSNGLLHDKSIQSLFKTWVDESIIARVLH